MTKHTVKIVIPSFDADEIVVPMFVGRLITKGTILSKMQSSAGIELIIKIDTAGEIIDELMSCAGIMSAEIKNVLMLSPDNSSTDAYGKAQQTENVNMESLSSVQSVASGITQGVAWARGYEETENKTVGGLRSAKAVHGYGDVITIILGKGAFRSAKAVHSNGTGVSGFVANGSPSMEGMQVIRLDTISCAVGEARPLLQEPDNAFIGEVTQHISTANTETQASQNILINEITQNESVANAISFPVVGTLAEDSWKVISELSQMGVASQYYSVGDTKDIVLTYADGTTETITVAIAGFNVTRDTTGTMNGITFIQVGHLRTIVGDYNLDSMLFDCLPQDLQDVIKLSQIRTCNRDEWVTEDIYLFTPEFANISDFDSLTNSNGGSQVYALGQYFATVYPNELDNAKFPLFVGKSKEELAVMLGIETEGFVITRTYTSFTFAYGEGNARLCIGYDPVYTVVHSGGETKTYAIPCFRV